MDEWTEEQLVDTLHAVARWQRHSKANISEDLCWRKITSEVVGRGLGAEHLVSIAWSLAATRCHEPLLLGDPYRFDDTQRSRLVWCSAACGVAVDPRLLLELQPRSVLDAAQVAWALATQRLRHEALRQRLKMSGGDAQHVAALLWSFATLDWKDTAFFSKALKTLQGCGARELSNCLWAMAKCLHRDPLTEQLFIDAKARKELKDHLLERLSGTDSAANMWPTSSGQQLACPVNSSSLPSLQARQSFWMFGLAGLCKRDDLSLVQLGAIAWACAAVNNSPGNKRSGHRQLKESKV